MVTPQEHRMKHVLKTHSPFVFTDWSVHTRMEKGIQEEAKDMQNPIRTGMYTGIGLALRTRDAVLDTGRRMAQAGSMSEDEGKKFVDDLLQQSEDVRGRLSDLIQERVSDVVGTLDLAKQSDIERLEKRIAELESELENKKS